MSDWTMIRWHGTPEAVADGLRELGWRGPEEAPAEVTDPRIGGFIPPPGQDARVCDGVAYAAVVANAPIDTPPGLAPTGPELSDALIGTF